MQILAAVAMGGLKLRAVRLFDVFSYLSLKSEIAYAN